MIYKTVCAISYKGDRVRPGTEVDLTAEEAANYGTSVVVVDEPIPEPTPEPEKAIDDMTAAELKDKAAAMGLATNGSKADLLERIKLAEGTVTSDE